MGSRGEHRQATGCEPLDKLPLSMSRMNRLQSSLLPTSGLFVSEDGFMSSSLYPLQGGQRMYKFVILLLVIQIS